MKKIILIVSVFGCLMLSGCASVYNLTTEESDLIAEYAAGVLCKNSFKNKDDYVKLKSYLYASKEQTTTKPSENEKPTDNPDENVEIIDPKDEDASKASQTANVSSIAEVLGMENVEITCLGYDVMDSYPKDEFALSTTATEGHKLIVVQYNLMNLSSQSVLMHVNSGVMVKAVINGSDSVNVYGTLLNDDILNMDGKELAPGETITGVFVFNVKEDLCNNIASLNVEARKK